MTKREIVEAINGIICTIQDDASTWYYDMNALSEEYLDDAIGDADCLFDDLTAAMGDLKSLLDEAEKVNE